MRLCAHLNRRNRAVVGNGGSGDMSFAQVNVYTLH
jgi:hypothetical protein